jgi:hypothetical protein
MDKNLFSVENLKSMGIAGLLAIVLWASFSGVFVWGNQYKEAQAQVTQMREERDKWQSLALEGTRLSGVATVKLGRITSDKILDKSKATPEEVAKNLDQISNLVEPGMERVPIYQKIKTR